MSENDESKSFMCAEAGFNAASWFYVFLVCGQELNYGVPTMSTKEVHSIIDRYEV